MNRDLFATLRGLVPETHDWHLNLCIDLAEALPQEELFLVAFCWIELLKQDFNIEQVEILCFLFILICSKHIHLDDKISFLGQGLQVLSLREVITKSEILKIQNLALDNLTNTDSTKTSLDGYSLDHIHQFVFAMETYLPTCDGHNIRDLQFRTQLVMQVQIYTISNSANIWLNQVKEAIVNQWSVQDLLAFVEFLLSNINQAYGVDIISIFMLKHCQAATLYQRINNGIACFKQEFGHMLLLMLIALFLMGEEQLFSQGLTTLLDKIETGEDLSIGYIKKQKLHAVLDDAATNLPFHDNILPSERDKFTTMHARNLYNAYRSSKHDSEPAEPPSEIETLLQDKLKECCRPELQFIYHTVKDHGEKLSDQYMRHNFGSLYEEAYNEARKACLLGEMAGACLKKGLKHVGDALSHLHRKFPAAIEELGLVKPKVIVLKETDDEFLVKALSKVFPELEVDLASRVAKRMDANTILVLWNREVKNFSEQSLIIFYTLALIFSSSSDTIHTILIDTIGKLETSGSFCMKEYEAIHDKSLINSADDDKLGPYKKIGSALRNNPTKKASYHVSCLKHLLLKFPKDPESSVSPISDCEMEFEKALPKIHEGFLRVIYEKLSRNLATLVLVFCQVNGTDDNLVTDLKLKSNGRVSMTCLAFVVAVMIKLSGTITQERFLLRCAIRKILTNSERELIVHDDRIKELKKKVKLIAEANYMGFKTSSQQACQQMLTNYDSETSTNMKEYLVMRFLEKFKVRRIELTRNMMYEDETDMKQMMKNEFQKSPWKVLFFIEEISDEKINEIIESVKCTTSVNLHHLIKRLKKHPPLMFCLMDIVRDVVLVQIVHQGVSEKATHRNCAALGSDIFHNYTHMMAKTEADLYQKYYATEFAAGNIKKENIEAICQSAAEALRQSNAHEVYDSIAISCIGLYFSNYTHSLFHTSTGDKNV
ncbi:hypothetical protein Ciccas_010126 [Cichlidogyrus casuarinus]|uniref:Uncharacterized protein n=1 Tax=Cichlidogyrus casuarinus TaxID=1844966 RepID=A0ABD2PW24_9PLAT